MNNKRFNVAVVGVTGAVGEVMLSILEERKFPIDKLYLVASSRSAGKLISFAGEDIEVQDLETFDFSDVDISLFSPGAAVSKIYAPKATASGGIVIDNTSQFRYQEDIPLVIPEVNTHALSAYKNHRIIANPNCSTIQMLVALKPIYDAVGISRINVCTYQAVSGSGKKAIDELYTQTAAALNGDRITCAVYPKQIAFNVLPHIDTFQDNGYTKEEMKMVWETQKILSDQDILVNPTTVRVPVLYGHSEAVHIETKAKISAEQVRELLSNAPGVVVIDDQTKPDYPTPLTDGAGKDSVFVGRIREDISHPNGVNLWVVSDNIRKGAALNAIQIAENMVKIFL